MCSSSFRKYFLRTYSVPGKVSSVVNKIEMVFYIMESSGEYG